MSESHKDSMSDDWNDGLTDEEYAELRRITTPHERKTILACAEKGDDKCNNKIKNILRDMQRRGVDLDLIWKYAWQSLDDRRHHERVADFIDEVKREGRGIKRTKGKTRRRTHKKTRRTHRKTRRY